MNDVCVVIPMFGHHEMTQFCVNATDTRAGMEVDILVVDDGSDTPFIGHGCTVIRSDENIGFTGAANRGLLWALERNYKYVHLLNNDTVPHPDFIKVLYEYMEANPAVGIVGSARVLNNNQKHNIEVCGADLIRGYQHMTDETFADEVVGCHWVPLCSALIRTETLRYIGILDRRMRTWCSDNDLCIRALFDGWGVAVHMKSKVDHIHQVTTGANIAEGVSHDQQVLLSKIANYQYADLMTKMPLDCENNTYGKLEFSMYQKEKK